MSKKKSGQRIYDHLAPREPYKTPDDWQAIKPIPEMTEEEKAMEFLRLVRRFR